MPTSFAVFLVAALFAAVAAFWVLRAYRRADKTAKPLPALLGCGGTIAAALAIYVVIGSPNLPDAPFEARMAALAQRSPDTFTVDEALAVLGQAAREHPGDPLPLIFSGQVLYNAGRDEEASRAFVNALRRQPNEPEAMLGLGRTMVRLDDGRVSPEARELFERTGAMTNDPAPWIYQAMAAMQEDRGPDAQRFWGEAYARMSADDPRREMARRMSAGETQ